MGFNYSHANKRHLIKVLKDYRGCIIQANIKNLEFMMSGIPLFNRPEVLKLRPYHERRLKQYKKLEAYVNFIIADLEGSAGPFKLK
ncbi:hypothetical protein [Arachidicoccus terrestris]|uniref:hypothetical protein n=1 Tax=Arachidicoccus terrestris TaxID=2875539 RepID=UPI001CC5451B|nr:hypothetical protein [Arachidicoccus terrestris]UAY54802.1 hypothetical protein K9M52_15340 [Arachidicoccus terrestris]